MSWTELVEAVYLCCPHGTILMPQNRFCASIIANARSEVVHRYSMIVIVSQSNPCSAEKSLYSLAWQSPTLTSYAPATATWKRLAYRRAGNRARHLNNLATMLTFCEWRSQDMQPARDVFQWLKDERAVMQPPARKSTLRLTRLRGRY
jgi:hypothetical protein